MILFALLTIIALLLTIFVVLSIGIGGATFIIVFGDVIVCIVLIVWLLTKLFKRNK